MYVYEKYKPQIPHISPENNVEIDRVWCQHWKILPLNLL